MYVHIPGGVDETPVEMTISASPGDAVKVRVANGRAWVTGNQTAPPTDDTEAMLAKLKAIQAEKKAQTATESAEIAAQAAADATTSAGIAGRAASVAQAAAEAAQATADSKKVVFTSQPTPPYHVGDLWVDGGSMTQTMSDGTNDLITSGAELLEALILGSDSVSVKYCIFARTEGESFSDADWSLAATDDTVVNELREWFWHDSTGAHILGDETGYRNDLNSTGMHIVDTSTETEVAIFAADTIQLRDKIGRDLFVVGYDEDEGSVSYSKAAGSATQTSIALTPIPKSGTTIYFYYAYTRNGVEYNASALFTEGVPSSQQTQYVTLDYTVNSGGQRVTVYPRTVQSCRAASVKYVIQANGVRFTLGWRDATKSAGTYSSVIGINCVASGSASVATNSGTTASGDYSHATGENTTASGRDALSTNRNTEAAGAYSLATGYYTEATGDASEAHGRHTRAYSDNQAVFGKYNAPDNSEQYAVIVGNGEDNVTRSNAFAIDWAGNVYIAGALTTGTDIDWTELPLNSACTAYSTATTPYYKRKGDLVTLIGDVKPTAAVASGGTLTIGQLPAECCPAQRISFLCQGSGTAVWLCQIAADGTITAGRYRTEAGTQGMTTSTWLPFAISYMV